jgi:hypothetical protein
MKCEKTLSEISLFSKKTYSFLLKILQLFSKDPAGFQKRLRVFYEFYV